MTFSNVVAWIAGAGALASVGACIVMRDLLRGRVPEAQLSAASPAGLMWPDGVDATGARIHARQAQRGQWLALASSTVSIALYCRPIGRWFESWTFPGAAWIVALAFGVLTAMWALDGLIWSENPQRDGRNRTTNLVRANHVYAVACIALVLVPWFFQPPQPRGPELDGFINYYQATLASTLSTLGLVLYYPVTCANLSRMAWRAGRFETDQALRASLRMIAAGSLMGLSVVIVQFIQAASWTLGNPVWSENQAAFAQILCITLTSTLVTVGCLWAPIVHKHQAIAARLLVPLWRDDIAVLRPMWRILHRATNAAYEPTGDLVTATDLSALREQHRRIVVQMWDALVILQDDFTATAREEVRAALGPVRVQPRQRLLRMIGAPGVALLSLAGGRTPERATRWWRYLTETPLQPYASTDAAAVRAAVANRMNRANDDQPITVNGTRPRRQRAVLWSTTPRSTEELAAYFRLLTKAAPTQKVADAARRAFFHMDHGETETHRVH